MEIKSFVVSNCNYNFKYRRSNCSHKSFLQKQRTTRQRLIPLTEEIVRTMENFNATPSNTSISDKQLYNTLSITSLVREEVGNILQDKYICKKEVDDLIEKCLKGKTTIIQDNEGFNKEIDDISVILNENEKNKLTIENLQILELRITNVEKRLSNIMHNIPKLRAHKLKINAKCNKDEICCHMDNIQANGNKMENTLIDLAPECFKPLPGDKQKDNTPIINDGIIYYERRENLYNLLNYKKSVTTLKLNEKVLFNPYVKPILRTLPEYRHKIKQRTTFIKNNV